MKIINKKGFTLIELLATILIIGVVLTISIVGVTAYISKGEEKGILISKTNVLSSAQDYVKEFYKENDWFSVENNGLNDNSIQYSCVSIEQLKSKGYLDKKVKDENYSFIIFKRDINSKVINYKNFAEDYEEVICNNKFIITPTPIKKLSYTNHITLEYKISSKLYDVSDENGEEKLVRDMEIISIKLNNQNFEPYYDIKGYGENNLFSKLILDFDSLIHNTSYDIEIKLNYKTSEENYKEVVIKDTIKTKILKAPVIEVEDENLWKESKEVNIKINKNNIYEKNIENSFIYVFNNKSISELQLGENNKIYKCSSFDNYDDCSEEIDNLNNLDINLYKIGISDTSYNFTAMNNDTSVNIYLSDGTNQVSSTKKVSKIDNHVYTCSINQESFDESTKTAVANIVVEDTTEPKNEINKDIVTHYKWENEKYKKYTGNGNDGIINTITVNKFGKYNAFVKVRTGREIHCDGDITDGTTPIINIEVSRNENVLTDTNTNWYNGTLVAKIFTPTENSYVSYCKVNNINETCEPDITNDINSETISFTQTGEYKIVAKATHKENNNSSVNYSVIIKVDNDIPSIASSKFLKQSDNSDVTSSFYKNDTWKNYSVKWTDFNAEDSHSGIDHYEYINRTTNGDSCNSSTGTKLKTSYSYSNWEYGYCIRAIDKAGNAGNWSEPYYIYVDTIAPKITVNAYARTSEGGKTGSIMASLSEVSSGNINSYKNTVNGWLNKKNYPYGIYYEVSYSDEIELSSLKWKYNEKDLLSDDSNVSELKTGKSMELSGKTGAYNVSISKNGHRLAEYIVTDKAGNISKVSFTAPIDNTAPTLKVDIYKRKNGGGLTGGIVATATANNSDDNKTIEKTSINENVNGWLNKEKYPYGIYFNTEYSDNFGLMSRLWETNPMNLDSKNSDNVNKYSTKNSGTLSGISGKTSVNFYGEGYRKGRYTITDIAGNKAIVYIVAPMDRTIPNPFIINTNASIGTGGYISLEMKSEANANPLVYEGKKSETGELKFTEDSCKDKNFETGEYTKSINGDNQYLIWDLSATSSKYKGKNTDTSSSTYDGKRTSINGRNWVLYNTYINTANPALSFKDAKSTEKVHYWRICKDRAGNYSRQMHLIIKPD